MSDLVQKGWFEKTPDDWDVFRMKNIMKPKEGRSETGDEELLSVTINNGVVKRSDYLGDDEGGSRSDTLIGYKLVESNNLVNNIMKMSFRCLGVSKYDGIVSPGYSVFELDKDQVSPSYLNYLLRTNRYVFEYRKLSKGIQESRMRLYDDYFLSMKVVVPPLDEQNLIHLFLDKKTQQIDSLIEKIQKKIELLKEQRTSLINQCVTKGLDPNVEMKDSGVEWIGEIPVTWDVFKLKFLFDIETGRDPSSIYVEDGRFDVLGTGGVIGKTNTPMWEKPSLILGRKGTIDKPFLQTKPFWISDVVYYTVQKSHITPEYLSFLFTQIDFKFYKYGSTLPSMSRDEYDSMKFPIPPESEMNGILIRLLEINEKSNRLVSHFSRKINLLTEYRQSLISSVVTGKVRVTEDMV